MSVKIQIIIPPLRENPTYYPPFGALYIAASLLEAEHDVQILNVDVERINHHDVLERVRAFSPDIIGFSGIVTTAYKYIKEMSGIVRKNLPGIKLVVGGSISAASEIILQNTSIDIVVKGEGEITIKELASSLNDGKDLTGVKGISFRDDQNKIVTTDEREQIKNIDDISYPAYDLLDMEHYLVDPFEYIKGFIQSGYDDVDPRFYEAYRRDKKMMVVHTARGCTHRCTFCQRHMKGIRLNSLDYLFDYIEFLMKKYNVGFFSLGAELFLPSKRYYWDFIQGMKERNLDILFYVCGARVNTVDKEILQALKEIGCWMIEYGFESGSQKVLDIMEKGTRVDQNIQVARWTKEAGLFTVPAIILGMPGETTETVRESIDFLKEIDIRWHQYSVNYPLALPGSALYDYARLKGYITDEDKYLESVSDTNASMLIHKNEKQDCFINYTDQPDEVVKSWQNLLKEEMESYYIKNKMKGNYAFKFFRVYIFYHLRKIPGKLQREGLIGGLKYLFGRLMRKLRVTLKSQSMQIEKQGDKTTLIPVRKEQDGNGKVITRSVSLRKIIKAMETGKAASISKLN
ncbi:MAG: radical SAM protein [Candidatus Brocadiaceae bacterium]|nr:radical SAM protein [Candidatus Brocadiaceae bacterium]